jgi:hypothetical protein
VLFIVRSLSRSKVVVESALCLEVFELTPRRCGSLLTQTASCLLISVDRLTVL